MEQTVMLKGNIFISELAAGNIKADDIRDDVETGKIPLASVFEGLSSKLPRVKFGCSKALLLLSGKRPELLSGSIDHVVMLLDNENRILKWSAAIILGNLAAVDAEGRVCGQLKKLYGFLAGGEMIAANNVIAALGKIARAIPGERKAIAARLVGIEHQTFETDECRNIAIGKAILALDMFCNPEKPGKPVFDFVGRQTGNSRKATANKAKAFMAKCKRSY
jgi:hypothetical protein